MTYLCKIQLTLPPTFHLLFWLLSHFHMPCGSQLSKYVFSADQACYLESLLLAFVCKIDPSLKGHSKEATQWKKDKLWEIKAHLLFTGSNALLTSDISEAEWDLVCPVLGGISCELMFMTGSHLAFHQLFNNKMKRSTGNTASAGTTVDKKNAASINTILHTKFLFSGNISAWNLFAEEKEAELMKLAQSIQHETSLNHGAACNQALKVLWEDTDQAIWEEKVKELARDTATDMVLMICSSA